MQVRAYAREAVELLGDRTLDEFTADRVRELALTHLLEVVGEAARRLPPADRRRYKQIDWERVINLRHRLAHGYDTVDVDAVWSVARNEFPQLIAQLDDILGPEETA